MDPCFSQERKGFAFSGLNVSVVIEDNEFFMLRFLEVLEDKRLDVLDPFEEFADIFHLESSLGSFSPNLTLHSVEGA